MNTQKLICIIATTLLTLPAAQAANYKYNELMIKDYDEMIGMVHQLVKKGTQATAADDNDDDSAFISAGGYHHHLGFNVWQGRGVGPAPPHTVGLRHWTVQLPTAAEVKARKTSMIPTVPVARLAPSIRLSRRMSMPRLPLLSRPIMAARRPPANRSH